MKRMLILAALAALAALILASCQKSEPAKVNPEQDVIGFASYIGRDVTKASVTDVTASNLSTFKVASYLTGTATAYFSAEQTATKQSSGDYKDYWTTVTTYYWPTSAKLDFFAYSGSGSGAVSNTSGVAKVTYTVPDTATEDFVVSYATNQGKPASSPYAQDLTFSHALAKVKQLTIAPVTGSVSADAKYKFIITDVKIAGAKNSADYTFNPSSGDNWGTASGTKDYTFGDKSFEFKGDTTHRLEVGTTTKVNDQLIILPQEAVFSVTYSIKYSGDSGTTWTEIMASTTKTAKITMTKGNAYTIQLQLPNDASPIIFSATVSDWTDATAVDTTVSTPSAI